MILRQSRKRILFVYFIFSYYSGILTLIDTNLGTEVNNGTGLFRYLFASSFGSSLAVGVRRLQKWMDVLVALIPLIGPIWLLILFCKDSQPQENKWDFNPREI